jgi:hypothetical protein
MLLLIGFSLINYAIILVTIQPGINVIGRINSPVLFDDTYVLNLDEIDGYRISMKKYTMNERK